MVPPDIVVVDDSILGVQPGIVVEVQAGIVVEVQPDTVVEVQSGIVGFGVVVDVTLVVVGQQRAVGLVWVAIGCAR